MCNFGTPPIMPILHGRRAGALRLTRDRLTSTALRCPRACLSMLLYDGSLAIALARLVRRSKAGARAVAFRVTNYARSVPPFLRPKPLGVMASRLGQEGDRGQLEGHFAHLGIMPNGGVGKVGPTLASGRRLPMTRRKVRPDYRDYRPL
jgi:hypothetical protein